jgi:hypothetical protein
MHSVAFIRRSNPDGSQTTSCPKCLDVVATASAGLILEAAENLHICNPSALSDSVSTRNMTLIERVMMFLKVRNA